VIAIPDTGFVLILLEGTGAWGYHGRSGRGDFDAGAAMLPMDDTYVPGYLISKASDIVGARRAAAFQVRQEGDGTESLVLFRYFPHGEGSEVTALELANALRRFVIPCLANGRDCVHEVPERTGPMGKTFVLIFLAKWGDVIRGATAMEVECVDRWEAERRLKALQRIMA
jgi:hypothetical protein